MRDAVRAQVEEGDAEPLCELASAVHSVRVLDCRRWNTVVEDDHDARRIIDLSRVVPVAGNSERRVNLYYSIGSTDDHLTGFNIVDVGDASEDLLRHRRP